MQEVDRVVEHIVRFTANRDAMTGAAIGLELQRRFPDFSIHDQGYRNLTDFLDRRVSGLSIVGRSGSDFLWSSGPADLDVPVADYSLDDDESFAVDAPHAEDIRFDLVTFRNFKSLVDMAIPLEPLTVFIGANGAGKTSVLEGIFYLAQLRNKKPNTVFADRRDPQQLRTAGATEAMTIDIQDTQNRASALLTIELPDSSQILSTVRVVQGNHVWTYDYSKAIPKNQPHLGQTSIFRAFGGAMLLRLSAHRIAKPSYSEEPVPQVRHDGHGIASVLADLAATDPEKFQFIIDAVKTVVPGFEDLRTPREEIRNFENRVMVVDGEEIRRRAEISRWGNRLELKLNGHWHNAHLVSEGTLLTLGLMTIVCAPQRKQRILLMDDLDRALHPRAQRTLLERLMAMQERFAGLQILCTTHSPYLIDYVPAESVRIMRIDNNGHSMCRKLTDHEEWNEWKDSMHPGEFWSFVGEDWLGAENHGE